MADQFFQMKQRNAANTDWDNLFPARKFETAGGTATAITLTIQDLIDGVSKTFVASASNSAAATTINGKNLYKPNTTTAPTLIAGKAYTVWYSSASDCFFIKASATGTVTSDKVLAGETYSTEDDTDLVGTMDLKAENIREGIAYAGIVGTVEEKQSFFDYLFNNSSIYTTLENSNPLGFIEGEGLWCGVCRVSTYSGAEGAILYDASGNVIKTINTPVDETYPKHVTEDYIIWMKTYTPFHIIITDKNGTLIKDITTSLDPATLPICFNKYNNLIYIVSSTGCIIYNLSGTLLGSVAFTHANTYEVLVCPCKQGIICVSGWINTSSGTRYTWICLVKTDRTKKEFYMTDEGVLTNISALNLFVNSIN